MLYKYDKGKMHFVRATGIYLRIFIVVLMSLIATYWYGSYKENKKLDKIQYISEETKMLIINEKNEFSEEKFKQMLLELNVRFPHIVMAQARLETGNYKSRIFKENNNLFGMKVARRRPTTNRGSQYNHALFDNWRESVIDYAFYQAAYLKDLKTEAQYLEYIRVNYAEDPGYYNKLMVIIKKIKDGK